MRVALRQLAEGNIIMKGVGVKRKTARICGFWC